jgi:hypothetical protein
LFKRTYLKKYKRKGTNRFEFNLRPPTLQRLLLVLKMLQYFKSSTIYPLESCEPFFHDVLVIIDDDHLDC